MAKIVINTDTQNMGIEVDVDGQKINASHVHISSYLYTTYDGQSRKSYCICITEPDKLSDMTKVTTYGFSDDDEYEEMELAEAKFIKSKDLPEFTEAFLKGQVKPKLKFQGPKPARLADVVKNSFKKR